MEAASQSRRDKLQALRKRKADEEAGLAVPGTAPARRQRLRGAIAGTVAMDVDDEEEEEEEGADGAARGKRERRYRNYDPSTGQAKVGRVLVEDTVENAVANVQETVLAADELARAEELDLLNIAPRKPNWDLKRDMERRLAKLERRDKEARLILIRQRITSQKGEAQGAGGGLSAMQAEMAVSAFQAGDQATAGLDAEASDSEEED